MMNYIFQDMSILQKKGSAKIGLMKSEIEVFWL